MLSRNKYGIQKCFYSTKTFQVKKLSFDFYKVNKVNVDLATWNIYTNLSKFENKF